MRSGGGGAPLTGEILGDMSSGAKDFTLLICIPSLGLLCLFTLRGLSFFSTWIKGLLVTLETLIKFSALLWGLSLESGGGGAAPSLSLRVTGTSVETERRNPGFMLSGGGVPCLDLRFPIRGSTTNRLRGIDF